MNGFFSIIKFILNVVLRKWFRVELCGRNFEELCFDILLFLDGEVSKSPCKKNFKRFFRKKISLLCDIKP